MAQIGTSAAFTTTEAVRGALGVDAIDLKDQQILDAELDIELGIDLASWCPDFAAKLSPADPATVDQLQLQAALRSYCKWYCALEYIRKPLAFVQLASDGKAEQRRFTNVDWEKMAEYCAAKVQTYRAAVAALDPTATKASGSYGLLARVPPLYDPITNTTGSA